LAKPSAGAPPTRFDGEWLRANFPDVATSMDGFTTDRRDVYTLKASGDGWKLALDEKLLKYAQKQTAK